MYNYEEAVDYILNIPRFSQKTTHHNIRYLMKKLGNPQEKIKVIHVAGTNGKGSVCAFTSSILGSAGYRVGMFTSPHLVKINERIRINNDIITDKEFTDIFNTIMNEIEEMKTEGYTHPSFFEVVFAMAVVTFYNHKVDYAILEVGLGGRLDATNIVDSPEVCVITSIGLDHTEILGDSIELIAAEKAAIIKKNSQVVYYAKNKEVDAVVRNQAEKNGIEWKSIYAICEHCINITKKSNKRIDFCVRNGYYDKDVFFINFVSKYQCINARLAIAIIEKLNMNLDMSVVQEGLSTCKWEGRMEQIMPNVYLDGSHNVDGINEFIKTVNDIQFINGNDIYLVFSAVTEKDFDRMIKIVSQNVKFSAIIVTHIDNSRAADINEIADCFRRYLSVPVYVKEDISEAFELGLEYKGEKGTLFCAGSLYLVGEITRIVKERC